jgi:hypothetical protein
MAIIRNGKIGRSGADMLIYGIFFVLCLVFIFFLAWRAPEGEEIPGTGFVEKIRTKDEVDLHLLQDGRSRLVHHNSRLATLSGHRSEKTRP